MKRLAHWIEIPVTDMDRAVKFYQTILGGVDFQYMEIEDMRYAVFPTEDNYNTGALVKGEHYKPTADGITVYLDGGSDLSIILNKVAANGGTVIMEKTHMGKEAGNVGMFIDCEGNKIGLQHP